MWKVIKFFKKIPHLENQSLIVVDWHWWWWRKRERAKERTKSFQLFIAIGIVRKSICVQSFTIMTMIMRMGNLTLSSSLNIYTKINFHNFSLSLNSENCQFKKLRLKLTIIWHWNNQKSSISFYRNNPRQNHDMMIVIVIACFWIAIILFHFVFSLTEWKTSNFIR